GQLGLAEATTIASDTMSGFGLQAEDMGRIADVMAKGANASTISVQMMGETFKYVSGVAKTASVSLEETAAMTAILGNAGIKGSMAGTTLKTMLLQLASPSKEASKIMSGLGIQTADAAGNMLPIADIIGDLQKSMSGFGNKKKIDIMSTIFGSEPAAGVLALLDKGKAGIQEMTEVMKNSGGSAADFAKKANANIKGMLKSLNSIIEEIQLKIFYNLIPLITPVLAFFTDSEYGMARTSFAVGLLATAIGVGLVLAAKAAMIAGYEMLVPYLPIIAIVAGITAGLAAMYLVMEDILLFFEYGPEASNTFFGEFLKGLGFTNEDMEKLRVVFNDFKQVLSDAGKKMSEFFDSDIGKQILSIAKWVGMVVLGIALLPAIILAAIIFLPMMIMAKWDQITDYLSNKWKELVAFFKRSAILAGKVMLAYLFPVAGLYIFRNEIKEVFQWLWNLFKNTSLGQILIEQFMNLKAALAPALSGIFESAKAALLNIIPTDALNMMIDSINWVLEKLNTFTSSAVVRALGIEPLNLPMIAHIQARAKGGPVEANTPYIVGERGPELRTFDKPGTIIPNNKLSSAGNGGSIVLQANFTIAGSDASELAGNAWEKLKQMARDNQNEMRVELGLQPV
ncbi:MAG TPA: phage tail tape measure protein, partial [Leptospiraceae bacterium]|nr:phage tail tape measure protein [Leptospiraceae bacterium]